MTIISGRPHKLIPVKRHTLDRSGVDDALPIFGRNVAAVAPLADLHAGFANVRSQGFGIVAPHDINIGKV